LQLGELNISGQHDRPFLLFDTPGEVARTLNRVVRLDVIDRALAAHAADTRRNGQESKVVEARLVELQGQEATFPDLEAGAVALGRLEAMAQEIDDKERKIIGLGIIQRQLTNLQTNLKIAQIPEGVPESLDWLAGTQADLEAKSNKFRGLHRLNGDIQDYSIYIQQLAPGLAQEGEISRLAIKQTLLGKKTARLQGLRRLQDELDNEQEHMNLLALGLAQDGWLTEALTKQNHLENKRRHLARLRGLNEQIARAKSVVAGREAIIKQREAEFRSLLPPECDNCPLFG